MRRLLTLTALFVSTATLAQTFTAPLVIDHATAQQHALHQYAPAYPPIAIAAHLSGNVGLQIDISPQGRVVGAVALSGPEMLKGAALDAVQTWVYSPFEMNGNPVPAVILVVVEFPSRLTPRDKTEKDAWVNSNDCIRAFDDKKHIAKAVKPCDQAAAQAEKLPQERRFQFGHFALELAAEAAALNGRPSDAVAYMDKVVDSINQGYGDLSDIAHSYLLRAQWRSAAGNTEGAEQDAALAEDAERKFFSTPAASAGIQHARYLANFRDILRLHAELLEKQGKKVEAQARLDEASKLS